MRRLFRSRKALSGVTQWFIDWGLLLGGAVLVTWIYSALRSGLGWAEVYRVFTLIDEPPHHLTAWLASVIGWLVVPALIGGVAGHVIATRMQRVKDIATNNLFQRRTWGQKFLPPGRITYLGARFGKSPADQQLLDTYVRVIHRGDWIAAQEHWEVLVRDVMCTAELADLHRREALEAAESFAEAVLWMPSFKDKCLVCVARGQ
ncbi:DUF6313 family protein [Streptomyces sp. NRRL B-24085]|uniref:DUF6313 family protein n=1 Tax=Streptomyces sp. NRRL B-24085 TaxID=1709476 RepID=UPI0006B3768B|nr:DUF6313 family protein [Streptomyces sp. NRRL B-24085]